MPTKLYTCAECSEIAFEIIEKIEGLLCPDCAAKLEEKLYEESLAK